jgi:hypothetical protein
MTVGVPREVKEGEHRVAATPDGVPRRWVTTSRRHDVSSDGSPGDARGSIFHRRYAATTSTTITVISKATSAKAVTRFWSAIRNSSDYARTVRASPATIFKRLLRRTEHPAGHRDRDPASGKVKDQRVRHFGSVSRAKNAASRRKISFSCSSSGRTFGGALGTVAQCCACPRSRIASSRAGWFAMPGQAPRGMQTCCAWRLSAGSSRRAVPNERAVAGVGATHVAARDRRCRFRVSCVQWRARSRRGTAVRPQGVYLAFHHSGQLA